MRDNPAEVIMTIQLAPVVREWSKEWMKRINPERRFLKVYYGPLGPIDHLSEKTGIPSRRLEKISAGDIKKISLAEADKLLVAMDKENLLEDGTLTIVPNPTWSHEEFAQYMSERGCTD